MSPWWSWLLTAWGVTGLVLAGRRRAAGWAVSLSAQGAWLAYAVSTRQWGFLVSAFAYGTVYARNWRSWRRTAEPKESTVGLLNRHRHHWRIVGASKTEEPVHGDAGIYKRPSTTILRVCTAVGCATTHTDQVPRAFTLEQLTSQAAPE